MSTKISEQSDRLMDAIKFQRAKKFDKARDLYRKVLSKDPDNAQALANLGVLEHQCGKIEESLKYINRSLELAPGNVPFLFNKGGILERLGNYNEAVQCYMDVLRLVPNDAESYYHLGNCLLELGDKDNAYINYQRALSLKPNHAKTYCGLGKVYYFKRLLTEAMKSFNKALSLNPKLYDAREFKGRIHSKLDQHLEAIACFKKAIKINPERVHPYIDLATCHVENCYWHDYETSLYLLKEITQAQLDQGNITTVSAFDSLSLPFSPEQQLDIAKSHSKVTTRNVASLKKELAFIHTKQREGRLKIGYVSADFKRHTVAHLSQGLFGGHNKDEFEIFCYALNPDDNSEYRRKIENESEHFEDITDYTHKDAAKLLYDDGINILVDLTGHTSGGRAEIFSLQPAPIQAQYLGFLGTLGADFIDYIITDEIVTPMEDEKYYTEKFVYMPHTYQINSHQHPIASTPTREKCQLPEDAIVFCCFNNNYKINPEIFKVWINILKEIPKAVLWLLAENEFSRNNLRGELKKQGISPDRLVFADKVPRSDHLARIRCADIYLDTASASARTSASDTLWAGLPVLTCSGNTFCNRIGASLLNALNMPELISYNLDDYYDKAIYYGKNIDALAALKEKLAANIKTAPMFDTPRFIKNLEAGYKEMWRLYSEGAPVQHIRVTEK